MGGRNFQGGHPLVVHEHPEVLGVELLGLDKKNDPSFFGQQRHTSFHYWHIKCSPRVFESLCEYLARFNEEIIKVANPNQ